MKKRLLALGSVCVLSSSLFGFEYEILSGDQMLGAVVDIDDLSVFNKPCVNYLYYENFQQSGQIEVYNVNQTITGVPLTRLNKGQGFILNASNSCSIVIDETPGTIIFKGHNYNIVTSTVTGRIWLDRNMGATKVCDKKRDEFTSDAEYVTSQEDCFGDYYQWGRETDGHEYKNSITTTILNNDIDITDNKFILTNDSMTYYDWTNDDNNGINRSINWSKTDGTTVCPTGFRVPTTSELGAEATNLTAFFDTLKVPLSGRRNRSSDVFFYKGNTGYLWSNTPYLNYYVHRLVFGMSGYNTSGDDRAYGQPIRCIKDE